MGFKTDEARRAFFAKQGDSGQTGGKQATSQRLVRAIAASKPATAADLQRQRARLRGSQR